VAPSPSNDAKFRRIFDAHISIVHRYCLRRLCVADANDAVSEVFLVAWRRIEQIPGGEETLPWLLGVTRNVVRNAERSARRSERLTARVGDEPMPHDPGPEVQIVRSSEYAEVAAALAGLKPKDREVIRLRVWEELTAPQIALVLGCSVAAAEKRITRAAARLSAAVEGRRSMARPRLIGKGGDDREG
jgi:RNA polymerase sigma-70 factor (ECF subfamily)